MLSSLAGIGIIVGIILVALITIGLILAKLYTRATKEVSFVRTGLGGEKVIQNSGTVVFPVFHEVIPVNMKTMRLEVKRQNEQALITHDRMRVDVVAEFYTRVQPNSDSIANAAQTLGRRTMEAGAIQDLVEGKFVDALRAVAAEMTMTDLHEKRADFVQKVQQAVSEDLLKNGLELEAVSLTGLDQTAKEHFNPDNAFDAAGLTKLTQEVQTKREERNRIERETEVKISRQDLSAEQETLQIKRDEEYARLEQEESIRVRTAEQSSKIAAEEASNQQQSEEAQIEANRQVDLKQISKDREISLSGIARDREIEESRIQKERDVEAQAIDKTQTLELAEQSRAIAVANKSKEESEAKAEADRARQDAVHAHEQVETVRQTEQAEREKSIKLVKARESAEEAQIGLTVRAEAEKQAALDSAEAVRTVAQGQSDSIRISAEGQANAERLAAEAAEVRYTVDAEGQQKLNEADNTLAPEIIAMRVKLDLLSRLPDIIAQSVKPMENIDSIKILQVDGLNPGSNTIRDAEGAETGSLSDQLVNSALKYRSQAPLLDMLFKDLGIGSGGDLTSLVEGANKLTSEVAPATK